MPIPIGTRLTSQGRRRTQAGPTRRGIQRLVPGFERRTGRAKNRRERRGGKVVESSIHDNFAKYEFSNNVYRWGGGALKSPDMLGC